MELYEKGKNNSLLSDTVQDVKDEIIEAFYSEEGDVEENIDVIEVKASARLRNLVAIVINRLKNNKKSLVLLVGKGAATGKVITLSEMVRKRLNNKNVKQWNSIKFTEEFEEWIPRENESQLEALKVARKIPFMAVLITAQECSLTTPPNSWTRQVELQSFLNVNGNRTSNKVSQQSNRKKTPRKKLTPINP